MFNVSSDFFLYSSHEVKKLFSFSPFVLSATNIKCLKFSSFTLLAIDKKLFSVLPRNLFAKKKKEGPLFGKPKEIKTQEPEPKSEPEKVTEEVPQGDAFFGELFSQTQEQPEKKVFSQELYEELRVLRNKIAMDNNVQPFQVFNNMVLKELATQKPQNEKELLSIHGVNAQKAEQLGDEFLRLIKSSLD